jgi:hypothetical protein
MVEVSLNSDTKVEASLSMEHQGKDPSHYGHHVGCQPQRGFMLEASRNRDTMAEANLNRNTMVEVSISNDPMVEANISRDTVVEISLKKCEDQS